MLTGAWSPASASSELPVLYAAKKGDDSFFREYMQVYHGRETVLNLKPNLVEHVDWLIGGSVLHQWREYLPRSDFWDDEGLIAALKERIRKRSRA